MRALLLLLLALLIASKEMPTHIIVLLADNKNAPPFMFYNGVMAFKEIFPPVSTKISVVQFGQKHEYHTHAIADISRFNVAKVQQRFPSSPSSDVASALTLVADDATVMPKLNPESRIRLHILANTSTPCDSTTACSTAITQIRNKGVEIVVHVIGAAPNSWMQFGQVHTDSTLAEFRTSLESHVTDNSMLDVTSKVVPPRSLDAALEVLFTITNKEEKTKIEEGALVYVDDINKLRARPYLYESSRQTLPVIFPKSSIDIRITLTNKVLEYPEEVIPDQLRLYIVTKSEEVVVHFVRLTWNMFLNMYKLFHFKPRLLMTGLKGSGKSCTINTAITALGDSNSVSQSAQVAKDTNHVTQCSNTYQIPGINAYIEDLFGFTQFESLSPYIIWKVKGQVDQLCLDHIKRSSLHADKVEAHATPDAIWFTASALDLKDAKTVEAINDLVMHITRIDEHIPVFVLLTHTDIFDPPESDISKLKVRAEKLLTYNQDLKSNAKRQFEIDASFGKILLKTWRAIAEKTKKNEPWTIRLWSYLNNTAQVLESSWSFLNKIWEATLEPSLGKLQWFHGALIIVALFVAYLVKIVIGFFMSCFANNPKTVAQQPSQQQQASQQPPPAQQPAAQQPSQQKQPLQQPATPVVKASF